MNRTSSVEQLIARSERISVVGSPSSTSELSLDILANAVTRKLVGELALFSYLQDSAIHYALGQITEIALRNIWHEDPTMRSLIRQHGRVDAVSERQDTHQGKMTISAVFQDGENGYRPSILGTVPPTGTPVHIVDDEILDELLRNYKSQLFYLGNVYGSSAKLPLWFKHFGSGASGAGEAYHIGIFGKTGSGKSVLSKMIMLAYARHSAMGIFVLDPQGEFSKGLRNPSKTISIGQILCAELLEGAGKSFQIYDLDTIQLDRWELFTELLLELNFFFDLGIKASNYQSEAADSVSNLLSNNYRLSDLANPQVIVAALQHLRDNIHRIYAASSSVDRVQAFIAESIDALNNGQSTSAIDRWLLVAQFFVSGQGKKTASQIVDEVIRTKRDGKRPLIVVDLSRRPLNVSQSIWNDKIKPLLIDRFISALVFEAERAYDDETSLNTLVVLDEAHRLAPTGRIENQRQAAIRSNLVDAVRTTRKYGLGWMFLSQTLSSLDNEIVQQLRISFFGFGLSMGTEYQRLRELVGGDKESMNLYQRFRDPQSAFDTASREYSFMTVGPVSPLSFAGTPLFLNAFNSPEDFMSANQLIRQASLF